MYQAISQGEVIGTVGNSGTTDFFHLHFEIRLPSISYPASTRNPMGYLPRPEVTTPTLHITALQSSPIYSPSVTLAITATRQELDVNQIRVILRDRVSGVLLDDQMVDFNQRVHTGSDSLDQDGIRLTPGQFNTSSPEYNLMAEFYNLHGYDSFTLTAQVVDLSGRIASLETWADDTTPPGDITTLTAFLRIDGGVNMNWIAPGDSGSLGTAASYEVRYANQPINTFVWESSAVTLPNPPLPVPGGQLQTWSSAGPFSLPVYFALKALDPEGNRSGLSNSAGAVWMTFYPFIVRPYDYITMRVNLFNFQSQPVL
jgi:hypothetical protein